MGTSLLKRINYIPPPLRYVMRIKNDAHTCLTVNNVQEFSAFVFFHFQSCAGHEINLNNTEGQGNLPRETHISYDK